MVAPHDAVNTTAAVSRSVTIDALLQASADFGAEPVERLALFEAAMVASKLDAGHEECEDRVGVLAQNPTWGPVAARRDPYTAATVFLRQVRRLRAEPTAPRTAAGLAARAQGQGRTWRYRAAHWRAGGTINRGTEEQIWRWVS